ncbi:Fis family transcriptional regulator [Proteus sp. FME41]|uniref:Fis family transcriptional regulator n=1 Tax=Proteus sp. FME41 TaxID=2742608 RepID=UPI0018683B7B|nr:Fis family transcriptional regulator [Proteus sp. FME41]
MKHRLKNALSLLTCLDVDSLISQFLELSMPRSPFSALIVSMINKSENRLESWSIDLSEKVEKKHLDVDITEADHPLIQLLSRPQPILWHDLKQGSYISDHALQQFIAKQPVHCGLFSIPFVDLSNKPYGLIIMLGEDLDETVYEQGIFSIYCNVFHHQLNHILTFSQSQQKISDLQYLLKLQQEKEEKINKTLLSLSVSNLTPTQISTDAFAEVNDLTLATEHYEASILRYQQENSNDDLNVIAQNLNISKRSLLYKLKKYGCLK